MKLPTLSIINLITYLIALLYTTQFRILINAFYARNKSLYNELKNNLSNFLCKNLSIYYFLLTMF